MFIEVITKEGAKVTIPTSRIYNLQPKDEGSILCLFPLETQANEEYLKTLIKPMVLQNSYEEMKAKLQAR
jgi:hypothetical protein